VVRHGETEWNRQLRVQGTTDIALNATGLAQARACADFLNQELGRKTTTTIHIYSSTLSRASDTALEIAKSLSSTKKNNEDNDVHSLVSQQQQQHAALNEWNLGVLEGMRKDEASQQYPSDWKIFSQWASPHVTKADATQRISNGGESMEQVRSRAVEFLEDVVFRQEDNITICVTHGGVLGQLLRHVAEQQQKNNNGVIGSHHDDDELEQYATQRPANGCLSRFALSNNDDNNDRQWKILSWADTSHLVGDAAPIEADYDK
jgi:broad specificity phosphatase PhoE